MDGVAKLLPGDYSIGDIMSNFNIVTKQSDVGYEDASHWAHSFPQVQCNDVKTAELSPPLNVVDKVIMWMSKHDSGQIKQ